VQGVGLSGYRGVGNSVVAGTPHSPPLSPPPYLSPGESEGHELGDESNSWFPMFTMKGTREAHGVISSIHSSHTEVYPVA
jgi:hypothetical protein